MGSTLVLLIAVTVAVCQVGAITCPPGWTEFNDNCYKASYGDWTGGRDYCNSQGYGMAVITDDATNEFIGTFGPGSHTHDNMWIGLNDRATEGTYVWTDGKQYNYSRWAPNEPNNGGNKEDCVEMFLMKGSYNKKWNDISCSGDRHYVCQLYGEPTTPVPPSTTAAPPTTPQDDSNFQCSDGQTIPKQWVCDRIVDCTDADDELVCGL